MYFFNLFLRKASSCMLKCCFCLTELKIKQEEETVEQPDNRSPALGEMGQTGEDEAALEDSMSSSPRDVHHRLSGANVGADMGNRQPNGISKYDRGAVRVMGKCRYVSYSGCVMHALFLDLELLSGKQKSLESPATCFS